MSAQPSTSPRTPVTPPPAALDTFANQLGPTIKVVRPHASTMVPSGITEPITGASSAMLSPPVISRPEISASKGSRITYGVLLAVHAERSKMDEKGAPRSRGGRRNIANNVRRFTECLGRDMTSLVGAELGSEFTRSLAAFKEASEKDGKKRQTVNDRLSAARALRGTYVELASSMPPVNFADTLSDLIASSSGSVRSIAKATGVNWGSIYGWARGSRCPSSAAIDDIHNLEDFFTVERGTLASKLPSALWTARARFEAGTTRWRAHQRKLCSPAYRYRLNEFPARLQEEWDRLFRFYTDPEWTEDQGLKQSSVWRIRWNTSGCPTGEIRRGILRSFYGYLQLPSDAPDPMLRGKGMDVAAMTLAVIGVPDLVRDYLRFRRARSVNQAYNEEAKVIVAFALQLLREETGYLWQHPAFGAKLPDPVPENEWRSWCEQNFRALTDLNRRIGKSRGRHAPRSTGSKISDDIGFRQSRDPFEPVAKFIEEEHPLKALLDLAVKLESLTPLLNSGSAVTFATHLRDVFQIRLVSSNPLRAENFSMMTYIPSDWEAFERLCDLYRAQREGAEAEHRIDFERVYVETDSVSNLYQRPDGSWWLRFNPEDFKNDKGEPFEQGVLAASYDMPISRAAWSALRAYIYDGRQMLNRALKNAICERRRGDANPPLSEVEECHILRCPYVFRPKVSAMHSMNPERRAKFKGDEQMPVSALSRVVYARSQKHLGCPGFGMHACRHIAATELIKNHPQAYRAAAAALHNTELMVRKHYARVTSADRAKIWIDHVEQLNQAHAAGTI